MRNRGSFLCAIIVIGCLGAEQSSAGVLAGPFVNPGNGFSYTLLTQDSWTNSEAEAVALGGHLATVNSAAEDNWLLTTFLPFISDPQGSLLIGFEDLTQNGQFVWTSGSPMVYTNWGSGEPNNLTSEITPIWSFTTSTRSSRAHGTTSPTEHPRSRNSASLK